MQQPLLLAGLDAALVRLGALAPVNSTDLGTIHGILMVYGFLGTAICLERAVAINSRWAYLSPATSALAGIAAIVISQSHAITNFLATAPLPAYLSRVLPGYQSQRMLPAVLWTISMITLVMIYQHVWKKRQASYAVLIQLIGALRRPVRDSLVDARFRSRPHHAVVALLLAFDDRWRALGIGAACLQ